MKHKHFIQSIFTLLSLIDSPKVLSSNKSADDKSNIQLNKLSDSLNSPENLANNTIVLLGVGQCAGKFLHDLKKVKLDKYKHLLTGQYSPEINYSFVDACFPDDTANFLWHHDFPETLNWHTHDTVNEIEEMSWGKYKSRYKFDEPEFLNSLPPETASRLNASNTIMQSEIQFSHDVEEFIEKNHRFKEKKIVIFIYDVSDQAARRLIKPLLLSAKRNRVDLTFSISLRSFIPNLSSSNNALFREMYYSSRQGEKYADFDAQFFADALNKKSINDWSSGYEPFESPVDKTKSIIDALSSLYGCTSLIAADISDFWIYIHGYKSTGFIISKYESKTTESSSLIAERACQKHGVQPHNPVLRVLVNIVVNKVKSLDFYGDILSIISNKLGATSVALINASESISEDTIQVTLISV